MKKTVTRALLLFLMMTAITGIAYPLAVTGMAQVMFPRQAGGSIVYQKGKPVGSELIGQNFSSPQYFHSRPSAAGQWGYDATSSSGSNLGPTNETLIKSVGQRATAVRVENNLSKDIAVPSDLVTASGSGLDPHITPGAALIQVPRVAKARQLQEEKVRNLVEQHIEERQLGLLGEPRVNVLKLNLKLDTL